MRKNNQTGRSMVEMLGVLAIIGVLSVGAIAGYSVAIEKYKLNKFVYNQRYFINALLQYDNLKNLSKDMTQKGISSYVNQLSLLPPDAKFSTTDNRILDSSGLTILPAVWYNRYIVNYLMSNNSKGKEILAKKCIALIEEVVKPMHENIYSIWLYRGSNPIGDTYYGSSSCDSSSKCLVNITKQQIHNLCNDCIEGSYCGIILEF